MAVPDFQSMMKDVLECARSGEIDVKSTCNKLASKYKLSDADLAELVPSGRQSRFVNRVGWAKCYLKEAGLLEYTKRNHYQLTPQGKEVLATTQGPINTNFLKQFQPFLEFRCRKRSAPEKLKQKPDEASYSSATPEEQVQEAYKNIQASLSAELLENILSMKPHFFEHLIVQLFCKMGYGVDENPGRTLGKRGDQGVDGVINLDRLGVHQIYLQAKRYQKGNPVRSPAIREFSGALKLHHCRKGIFVTTSSFTAAAEEEAKKLGSMVLIDGDRLAELMIQYSLGCRETESISLKKIDEDFFDESL